MNAVSLFEWLHTGTFGPITLGMTRSEVRALLGPPDNWSVARNADRSPIIWKYGDFEFYFDSRDGPLHLLRTDTFRKPVGGKAFTLDPWILRRGLSRRAVKRQLASCGIDAHWRTVPHDSNQIVLDIPGSGVTLSFILRHKNSSPPTGLHSLSATTR